jgi:hypothetical protein
LRDKAERLAATKGPWSNEWLASNGLNLSQLVGETPWFTESKEKETKNPALEKLATLLIEGSVSLTVILILFDNLNLSFFH